MNLSFLSFYQFSPCANVNLHRPSPTSCPLQCSQRSSLSCCRWSSLRCPQPKTGGEVDGAIVKIILAQNTGQKPKLVLLEIAWLSHFITWFYVENPTPGPTQMTNNHDILHQEECKVETEFIEFCKALHTWICSCEQTRWTGK